MPRARDRTPPASAQTRVPQTFGPSGKSSPVAALMAMQQEQEERFSKLIETMEKAQVENQRQVAAAAQAGGGAATEVANQVARGIERQGQKETRQQERAEDKAFAEDQQRLNAKLQSDAAKEAAAMGAAVQGQREAIMNFRESFKSKKDANDEAIAAYGARTDEMLTAGWFSNPKGREELKKRRHLLDMMSANHDDHFDDRHLAEAYRLHNQNVQALIAGDEVMDLSNLIVEPLMMPMVDPPHQSGKRIAKPGEISPDKRFEMKMFQGYPRNGVVFNDEENFGLPEGYSPRLMNADIVLDAMARDDYLRFATDKSLRQELDRKNAEIVVQSMDRLQPHLDMYEGYNKTFNPMAGGAIERSLETFLADPNPNKFNDMGRQLTFGAVAEIFGGGKNGDEIATIAAEIFDGKRELKSDKELAIAMALESALFNIKEHMITEFQNVGEGGASLASSLVQQMEAELGPEQTALALGVPSNAVGLVKALDAMQGRLAEASAFANRAHMGFEKNSIIEQFQGELGRYARLADIYATRVLNEGTDNERRVQELMSTEEVLEGAAGRVAATPPGEVAGSLSRVNAADLQSTMSHMDAIIQIGNDLGPDVINEVSAFITAELEPLTSPNLQAYINQTRVEQERSGYVKNAVEGASFNHKRNQRAREAREAATQRQGPGSVGESFEKGGAIGTVTEQVPAFLSLGFNAAHRGIERTAIGAIQMTAGKGATTWALTNLRKGEEEISRSLARGLAPQSESNLTRQEREQVLRGRP